MVGSSGYVTATLGDLPRLVSVSSGRRPSGTMRDTRATKALIMMVARERLVEHVAHKE
jgi:hypothetical protein